ncbi:MAG: shikimate dehydrogenase [Candidatus Omnitrophica bacterium]|nr:shikimate dehydrogenase [Candidatus Omnitrophota bacterium]
MREKLPKNKPETTLVALFGFPVKHTLSPLFQNAAFQALGMNTFYLALEVPPEELPDAINAIRSRKFLGANLTIPHKETVIPFLDEVSLPAQKCGSVNTVVNHNGKLRGETTDGPGFIRSLKEEAGITPKGKRIFLIGAGGAARALAFSLAEAKASICLTNRTAVKGEKLVSDLKNYYPQNTITYVPFSEKSKTLRREKIDVLINATSLGLKKEEELFRPADLAGKIVVCDLIYNRKTLLLQSAQELGLKTINGLGMLIHQGALSFQLWTGKTAPIKIMFAAVK